MKGKPIRFVAHHQRRPKIQVNIPPDAVCICGDRECQIAWGFCHCGCGQKTSIYRANNRNYGWKRGYPCRFYKNHGGGVATQARESDLGRFKIEDVYCRLIPLGNDLWAIVDEADYQWLMGYRWWAMWAKGMQCYYAVRGRLKDEAEDGWPSTILMHRFILGIKRGRSIMGDHKETLATLDNRRKNLRKTNARGQNRNRRKPKTNTSGYKGVYDKGRGANPFCAQIRTRRGNLYLGCRATAEAAYTELYVPAVAKYHGIFGRVD
jgi:hypothetical protein